MGRQILRELHEAEARSMRALFEAWDRELDAQAEALRAAAKKQQAEAALESIEVAAFEAHVRGLLDQAKSGADISVPAGMRAASTAAPSDAALDALFASIDFAEFEHSDQARRSAAWALREGLLPHPADLAALIRERGLDAPWAAAFDHLGQALGSLDAHVPAHPQLKMHVGRERVDVLRHQLQLLRAFGPERTFTLITRPEQLTSSLTHPPPAAITAPAPKMGMQALGKMLDRL